MSYAGDHPCSYPAAYNPQDDHDPYHSGCGNGRRNGQWLTADPTRAGVQVGPAFSAQWIAALKAKYGDAQHGGVSIYALGNEPALWDETHHGFHPQPTTYDELWSKSRDLAVAVKDADPGAATLGPAEWGWPNYFCSAADNVDQGCSPTSPDRAAHGGTELSAWYLRQFAAYQQQTGRRLLDYFDLHYYPQGQYSPVTDVTRPLWDTSTPTPRGSTRRSGCSPGCGRGCGATTRARSSHHRVQPGHGRHLGRAAPERHRGRRPRHLRSRGARPRDVLARRRLAGPGPAFRIFRNYDGRHHGFGNYGVSATSSDQRRVSVYAARVGKPAR